ncbi:MAG: alkaline phosphatase [Clostridia bacterium]|nr:alkaline phosphatase [Clostridia bacterium]
MFVIINKIIAWLVSLSLTLAGAFCVGEPVNAEEYKVYDNVILFIGDGMGEKHLKATKKELGISLQMETMPVRGQSMTDNWLGETTDSAAGGTALATGIRTGNGNVAVTPFDTTHSLVSPKTLAELAKELGKAAGVVTTDQTTGATPSSFTAHTASRSDAEKIFKQQMVSDFDLIWGATCGASDKTLASFDRTIVRTADEMEALKSGEKSYGQFSWDDFQNLENPDVTPSIEEMTVKAIDLLDDDADGFFLMVEGAHIDKHSHNKNIDNAIKHVAELDKAVAYALDYAEKDGDTLVVVTADHETGKVTYDETLDKYVCLSGSHTDRNVPLLVSDEAAGFVDGVAIENRSVGAQLGLCLGAEVGTYPVCTPLIDTFQGFLKEWIATWFK